jgi:hypothetical protein
VSPESYGHEGNQLGLKARDTWEEYLDYEPDVGGESHSPWTGQPPQPQHERPAFPSDLPHPPPGPHNPHDHPHPPHYPPHFPHKFPIHKFIKAAKRVAKANKKLIDFERGFISEGGIKDREWYKHLGVAPGKWLGEYTYLIFVIAVFLIPAEYRIWGYYSSCINRSTGHRQ